MRKNFLPSLVVLLAGAALVVSSGCNIFRNLPSAPDSSDPGPAVQRTIRVVSCETFSPIQGAFVTVGKNNSSSVTDGSGYVTLEAGDNDRIKIEATGFLGPHDTPLNGEEEFCLFPERPGFERSFIRPFLYKYIDLRKLRNSTLKVHFSDELRANREVVAIYEKAIPIAMSAFNGHVRPPETPIVIEIIDVNDQPNFGVVLEVFFNSNPDDPPRIDTSVDGDNIIYRASRSYNPRHFPITNLPSVLYTLGAVTGLGSTGWPGIMQQNNPSPPDDFTDIEKLAMRMSLWRKAGNQFPDCTPARLQPCPAIR